MAIRDFLRGLVGEVPPEDAVCEFRCRKLQCRHGEWEQCDYRLRGGLPLAEPSEKPEGGDSSASA